MNLRIRLSALVACIAALGLVTPSATAVTIDLPPGSQIRLAGANRYETAVEISQATFAPPADLVFVATGENFPDALAVGPLAGLLPETPVLLVKRDSLPTEVVAEIQRLGPDLIVAFGGPAAISDSVLSQLDGLAGDDGAVRLAGANRYETAALIGLLLNDILPTDTVFLTTGENYPDALSGGPVGGLAGLPILLASKSGVPASTLAAMQAIDVGVVIFLGGTGVLPDSLAVQIADALSSSVAFGRLSGADRYGTSAAVAEIFSPLETDVAYIAVGDNFPDALAAASSAAANEAPILLSRKDCMPTPTYESLQALEVSKVVLLGGPNAISSTAPSTECPSALTQTLPYSAPDLDLGVRSAVGAGGATAKMKETLNAVRDVS